MRDRRRQLAKYEFVDIFKKVHLFGQVLNQLGVSFDPLGSFLLCFVKAKLMPQRFAIEKYGWNDKVSESMVKKWKV